MPGTFKIDPEGIYGDAELVLGLGLTFASLAKARRRCQLRYARKGKRILYRGHWVLDWLDDGQPDSTLTDQQPTSAQGVPHGPAVQENVRRGGRP